MCGEKERRAAYRAGWLAGQARGSIGRFLKSNLIVAIRGNEMGRWYSFLDITDAARANGFAAKFYGSMLYPSRFHAVLLPL